ncbi:DNA/RNA nuclease SfsA [Methanobacterium aggregans]|uniref:DNA/RNA nuclease SfsA n=1 Tax=Methanobacterium aggregans TaxID=1615586 RepID=UPI001AE3DE41|nr:DNA/RNA nuclease SfsA [Methanobacterium aggregans]MBP2046073.1 sugar fermentation stimulation protein A [Methanobacterium aggregans]
MIISNLITGSFIERPNRFTVIFRMDNFDKKLKDNVGNDLKTITEKAHLRDPGRLEELLFSGVKLLLRPAINPEGRKTKFDVIAVFKDNNWVLINSGFHSDIAQELIESGLISEFSGYSIKKREYSHGKSRIDFLLSANSRNSDNNGNNRMLLEVKGCTLVEEGHARFPDAPTKRGRKHVEELKDALEEGYISTVLFLVLKEDADDFAPNRVTDPDFSDSLNAARDSGVLIVPYSFKNIYKPSKKELEIKPFKRVELDF